MHIYSGKEKKGFTTALLKRVTVHATFTSSVKAALLIRLLGKKLIMNVNHESLQCMEQAKNVGNNPSKELVIYEMRMTRCLAACGR